ncbi:hypothetical protein, partial [Klebsiella pneumoniae]|uniref:hypothetical protein n=1 Tax=Klebsiella pneumoniae TaxID=573 RepID=UPI002730BEE0
IADSMNLTPISLRARTTVAGVSINMGGILDPYMVNEDYQKYNKYVWNEEKGFNKLGRLTRANLTFGMNFNSTDKKANEKKTN